VKIATGGSASSARSSLELHAQLQEIQMIDPVETYNGLRPLADLPLEGRRVFVRADFDGSEGLGDERFRLALPTLEAVRSRGARLIVATALARPNTRQHEQQIEPVAARLAELLGAEVLLPDECAGEAARKVVQELRPGQVCVLENLGSAPEESSNDRGFAERLASFTDVYVNDAFAASNESSASIDALPRLIRDRGMGLWLEREVRALDQLEKPAARPFLAVLGGPATRRELSLLDALLRRADQIAVGGALGTTLLAASGTDVQASTVNPELFATARTWLARARDRGLIVHLPVDLIVADDSNAVLGLQKRANAVPHGASAFDVGPDTIAIWSRALERAGTVLWAGALGALKNPAFAEGSLSFARALAASTAVRVVLDGPLLSAISRGGDDLVSKIGFVSTGGRASLEYIEGRLLPGIEALRGGAT
jgi:phosphoglycerate kinase